MSSSQHELLTESGSTPSDDGNNAFSRANAFGLFLTLSFCLLVQPVGSLLYTWPPSSFGRAIFFFWRLSPLASAMEALLLVIGLLDSIRDAFMEQHMSLEGPMGFWKHLQLNIMAVRSLREQEQLPDHHGAIDNEERFHWTESIQPSGPVEWPHPVDRATQNNGTEVTVNPASGDRDNGSITLLLLNFSRSSLSSIHGPDYNISTPNISIDITDRQSIIPATYQRSALEAEEGIGDRPSDFTVTRCLSASRSDETATIRNTLPRTERLIDISSTVSVIVVIVKLAALTIPSNIRIPAWCMVASWATVQTLVLMSPSHHKLNHIDTSYLISRRVKLEETLNDPISWAVLPLLFIPLFECLTYAAFSTSEVFRINMKLSAKTFTFRLAHLLVLVEPLCWAVLLRIVTPNYTTNPRKRNKSVRKIQSATIPLTKLYSSVELVVLRLILRSIGTGYIVFSPVVASLYAEGSSWQFIIASFFIISPCMFCTCVFYSGDLFSWDTKHMESMKYFFLLSNFSATVLFFVGTMTMYDANETYKPSWIEWLGKQKRYESIK